MSKRQQPTYFPGLNGLRFVAASLVIITHLEQIKESYKYSNVANAPYIEQLGFNAVTFFFVLSGFLITYLLLEEQAKTGTISVKQFYLKRILRIWPIYFLIVLSGLFVLPHIPALRIPGHTETLMQHFNTAAWLDLTILPNVVLGFFGSTAYLMHTWSIGVEEQFYLIWPLLMAGTRKYLKCLLGVIAVYLLIKIGLVAAGMLWSHIDALHPLRNFVYLTRIDCMAVGGIGAYLLFTRSKALNLLLHPVTHWSAIGLALLIMVTGLQIPVFWHEVMAVLFLLIIMPIATNRSKFLVRMLESRTLNFLGTISYGIYMYHLLVIGVVMLFFRHLFDPQLSVFENVLLYVLTVGITVLLAALSYFSFEQKIIRLRPQVSQLLTSTYIRSVGSRLYHYIRRET